MIFIVDLGVVLITAVVFIFIIAGGIVSAVEFLMANLVTIFIVLALIGLVLGFILGVLRENKSECIPSALTFPITVLFPCFVMIPYYIRHFEHYRLGDGFTALLSTGVLLIFWIAIAFVSAVSVHWFDDESDSRTFLETLVSGLIGAAVDVGLTWLAYALFV